MAFSKRHWLYASVGLMVLLCVALGTFLVWRANQPVETKTVYVLPEPNPERVEILKRALQPPPSAYTPKVTGDETTTDNTNDNTINAGSVESLNQENEFEDENLETMLVAIDEEATEKKKDFPLVPEGFPSDLTPVWIRRSGYKKGDMPDHELIYRVLIKLWNQGDRGFQGAFFRDNDRKIYPFYPDVLYVEWSDAVSFYEDGIPKDFKYIQSSSGTHRRQFELEDFITGEWRTKYPNTRIIAFNDAGYDPYTFLSEDD